MALKLFHASQEIFRDVSLVGKSDKLTMFKIREWFEKGKYEEVATFKVGFDSLEAVYARTQNIDSPWRPEKPTRSTSVGDLVQDTETGKLYVVAMFGFEEVE